MILVQRSPNSSASSHPADLGIGDGNRVDSLNRSHLEIVDDTEQTNEITEPIAPYLITSSLTFRGKSPR